jgi:hypothetical protein
MDGRPLVSVHRRLWVDSLIHPLLSVTHCVHFSYRRYAIFNEPQQLTFTLFTIGLLMTRIYASWHSKRILISLPLFCGVSLWFAFYHEDLMPIQMTRFVWWFLISSRTLSWYGIPHTRVHLTWTWSELIYVSVVVLSSATVDLNSSWAADPGDCLFLSGRNGVFSYAALLLFELGELFSLLRSHDSRMSQFSSAWCYSSGSEGTSILSDCSNERFSMIPWSIWFASYVRWFVYQRRPS